MKGQWLPKGFRTGLNSCYEWNFNMWFSGFSAKAVTTSKSFFPISLLRIQGQPQTFLYPEVEGSFRAVRYTVLIGRLTATAILRQLQRARCLKKCIYVLTSKDNWPVPITGPLGSSRLSPARVPQLSDNSGSRDCISWEVYKVIGSSWKLD